MKKYLYTIGKRTSTCSMAYFSMQYCTLYAVLVGKCAVLNLKLCGIRIVIFSEIYKINDVIITYLSG